MLHRSVAGPASSLDDQVFPFEGPPQLRTIDLPSDVIERWKGRRPEWFVCTTVDPGDVRFWAGLLDQAFTEIDAVLTEDPAFNLELTQIKEKIGTLRVYFKRHSGVIADARIAAILDKLREDSEPTNPHCSDE